MANSPRVGCLYVDSPSPEQRAAYDWCDAIASADVLPLDALPDANGAYDACWWHRDEPIDPGEVAAHAGSVGSYLRDGGNLLLSLRALSAVDALDVDPVAPDAVGVEDGVEPTGYLAKSIYRAHPAFEGFDGLRAHTAGDAPRPYARYEDVLPERGDVLAATVRGEEDVPHELPLVAWRRGRGSIVGAGAHLTFDAPDADERTANRSRLVRNLLIALAADEVDDALPSGRPKSKRRLEALRARLAGDQHRPRYHISPPANWLNDPNGLIEWNGRYHVFYQYNPAGPHHGTIHWGHAVSDDLVHWSDEAVALSPSVDGPDRDGCWSGCAIDDDGTATLLYTGGRGRRQLPCRATATDSSLSNWTKDDANPIIASPPADVDVVSSDHWEAEFRDHSVWRENGTWYQLIGSGVRDAGGAALLYTSDDLRDWEYEGPLLVGDREETGAMWECPELLDFGDRHVLHVSNYEDVTYFVGGVEGSRFEVERRGKLDYGDYYAPQSLDDGDRYLTWGWLPEARGVDSQWEAGWSGALSLPRVLALGDAGELRQRPAPELERLREERVAHRRDAELAPGEERSVARGGAIEVRATVDAGEGGECGLVCFASPDGGERTPIRVTDDEIVVDRAASSLDPAANDDPLRAPIGDLDRPIDLRAFVDGSIVELFANERRCLTARVYPTRPDSDGLSVYAHDEGATVESLDAWRLGSAWRS